MSEDDKFQAAIDAVTSTLDTVAADMSTADYLALLAELQQDIATRIEMAQTEKRKAGVL